jgi:hypothetical protein
MRVKRSPERRSRALIPPMPPVVQDGTYAEPCARSTRRDRSWSTVASDGATGSCAPGVVTRRGGAGSQVLRVARYATPGLSPPIACGRNESAGPPAQRSGAPPPQDGARTSSAAPQYDKDKHHDDNDHQNGPQHEKHLQLKPADSGQTGLAISSVEAGIVHSDIRRIGPFRDFAYTPRTS